MITKQRRELRPDPPLNQRLPDSDCRGCRQWECLGFTVLGFHGFGISDLGIGLPIVFFFESLFPSCRSSRESPVLGSLVCG